MKLKKGYDELIRVLEEEKVESWFDMGLFLDRIKDDNPPPDFPSTFDKFKGHVKQGVAFVTFNFGDDGVSIDLAKYAASFEELFGFNV